MRPVLHRSCVPSEEVRGVRGIKYARSDALAQLSECGHPLGVQPGHGMHAASAALRVLGCDAAQIGGYRSVLGPPTVCHAGCATAYLCVNTAAAYLCVNTAAADPSAAAQVTIYNNSAGTVQVKLDTLGWYMSGPTPTTGGAYVKTAVATLVDTRIGIGVPAGAVRAHGTITVQVNGRLEVPLRGVTAVWINLNAISPAAAGYLTAWPAGAAQPPAQQSNFTSGQTTASYVIARGSSTGQISIYNGSSSTVQIADIIAYAPSNSA